MEQSNVVAYVSKTSRVKVHVTVRVAQAELLRATMEAPPPPPLPIRSCNTSRCKGKSHPLSSFGVKKNNQLSATCLSCAAKSAESARNLRAKKKHQETAEASGVETDEEVWCNTTYKRSKPPYIFFSQDHSLLGKSL